MAHFKRRRCKRQVKCTKCTQHRWKGNSTSKREGRHKRQQVEAERAAREEAP